MMERDDIIIRQFLILLIERVDKVHVFRYLRNDDDVSSDEVFLVQPFAE